MSLLKVNEVQNFNGSSLTLTASTVSTSAQLNTGGNISVTGSLNASDTSTTRTNLGLGTMATQNADAVAITGGTFPSGHVIKTEMTSAISGSTTSNTDVDILSHIFTTTVTNSKIYIMMTLLLRAQSVANSNNFVYIKLFVGSTVLLNGFPIVGTFNTTDTRGVCAWNYLYSPNLAAGSSIDFELKMNALYCDTAFISSTTQPSHITFMEIAP